MPPSGAGRRRRARFVTVRSPISRMSSTDPQYRIQDAALTAGFRAVLGVPMLREGARHRRDHARAGPARRVQRRRRSSCSETFADQAVIAVENVRLFTELETVRNRDLTEYASSSRRPRARSCGSSRARRPTSSPSSTRSSRARSGSAMPRSAGSCGSTASCSTSWPSTTWHPAGLSRVPAACSRCARARTSPQAAPILERAVVHIADVLRRSLQRRHAKPLAGPSATGACLAVPMLRDGMPLGAIFCWRPGARGPSPSSRSRSLQTFADQAVIAIENVRLFTGARGPDRET